MEEPENFRAALAKLIEDFDPPIHLTVLLRSYRISQGREFSFEAFGYTNPVDFFKNYFPELTLVECDKTTEGFMIYSRTQMREAEELTGDAKPSGNLLPPATPFSSPNAGLKMNTSKLWVKKAVPIQFKLFLARILDQYPLGISAKDFVDVFFKTSGSPLSYKLYGYPGHHSMFKDLPDVFRIEVQPDGELRLFPIDSSKDSLKPPLEPEPGNNPEKYVVSEVAEEGDENQPPLQKDGSNLFSAETNSVAPAVKKWKTINGYLITVVFDDRVLVPTACIATLLQLDSDNILVQLKQQGIDIRGVKFLSPDIPKHLGILAQLAFMGCSSVLCKDGSLAQVITLLPLESCSFILRAFAMPPSTVQRQLEKLKEIMSNFKTLKLSSQM